jgi:hypothetical protein
VSEFYDMAEHIRGQDDVAREHRRMEISEETIDVAALIAVAVGVVALYLLLGGWRG